MKLVLEVELSPMQIHDIAKEVARINSIQTPIKVNSDSENLDLITVKEASELARVSRQTILRHIEAKLLTAKKTGKSYKIIKNDFLKYINGKTNLLPNSL